MPSSSRQPSRAAQASAGQPASRSRPTRCRPTSWPRPLPSAASATSWTSSARSGAWPFSGCCWPPAPPPALRPGPSASAAPPLDAGAALLRRLPGHHHPGRPAPRPDRPACRAAATASACRAGEAGSATRPRRWAFRCSSALPFCCSSTGSSAAGRAATGSALWVVTLPLLVLSVFVVAAARAHLQQVRAARQEPSRAGRRA